MTERKEIFKVMKEIVRDILDHYEDYTEEEQKRIKSVMKELYLLNVTLDKYDEKDKDKKKLKEWFKDFLDI